MAHKINLAETKRASHNPKYVESSRKISEYAQEARENVKSGAFVSLTMNKTIHGHRWNTDSGPSSKGTPKALRLATAVRGRQKTVQLPLNSYTQGPHRTALSPGQGGFSMNRSAANAEIYNWPKL